jgi:hypothetical protein
MTKKLKIEINLDFWSECSEADLYDHAQSVAKQIEHYAKELPRQSWMNRINVSWDESFPVRTDVTVKIIDDEK